MITDFISSKKCFREICNHFGQDVSEQSCSRPCSSCLITDLWLRQRFPFLTSSILRPLRARSMLAPERLLSRAPLLALAVCEAETAAHDVSMTKDLSPHLSETCEVSVEAHRFVWFRIVTPKCVQAFGFSSFTSSVSGEKKGIAQAIAPRHCLTNRRQDHTR